MRLAYLTSLYARAGDTFIRTEVRELRRLGHEVHTFSIRRPPDSEVVDEDIAIERANTSYIVDGPRSMGRLFWITIATILHSPLRFGSALRLAFSTGPAGIQARFRQAAYVIEAAYLARSLGQRRIEHLHDHIGENSGTVAMLASLMSGIPFSMTIHGPGTFYAARQHGLDTKIARSAFTVCISEFCRSQCMLFAAPEHWDRLRIVRCGVDAKSIRAEPIDSATKPKIVSVGRLCAEKGHLILIEAAARVAAEGIDFQLVIVGDGPMRTEIERRIHELNASSFIRLTGWGGSESVRREMICSRIVALASFAEGLPVVLMEALALGRPVISTSIAGIPELVEAGVNGWLVPPSSVDALADAIRQALNSPTEKIEALGRAGAAKVNRLHNITSEVGKLAELFSGSIAQKEQSAQSQVVPPTAPATSMA